jgi:precorrin-6B methylase 2
MLEPEIMRQMLACRDAGAAQLLRQSLEQLPNTARDAWLDAVLGVGELGPDAALPRGCVPYLPCAVDIILRAIDQAQIAAQDVFVDIGSGVGRVAALVHFLTGADAVGIEIQSELVRLSRGISKTLNAPRLTVVEGDAAERLSLLPSGSVFFLYCPFSGARLEHVLDVLRSVAQSRQIRVCAVHLPPISRPWLEPISSGDGELSTYRSVTT